MTRSGEWSGASYSRYGPPDVVQIKDVEKPVPKNNEVLIKVRAASVNPLDRYSLRVSVAFQSARITGADISYSSPSLLSTAQTQPPILVTFGLVITAAVLAALAFRRFSVFGGLWLALPGYVACSQPILDAVFVPSLFHARDWLALLCSFGAAVAGLRLIVGSLKPAGYWTRLGVLTTSFVAPITIVFAVTLLRPGVTIWVDRLVPPILAVLLYSLLAFTAAALAAIAPPSPVRTPAPFKWKHVVWGVATTLSLIVLIPSANALAHRARHARRQASLAAFPKVEMGSQYPKVFFQRGISLLIEGESGTQIGQWVEPESAAATLDVLRKYGVNAIALVSFGKPEGPEAGLLEAIASMAHLREVKVMLKPQIWGPNGYPGTIDVSTAAERDRWFRDYGGLVENAPTGKER